MLKKIFLFVITVISTMQITAKDLTVAVTAKQEFTRETITDFSGFLLPVNGNDTITGVVKTSWKRNGLGMFQGNSELTFTIPNEDATYILTANSPGYDEIVRTITIKKRGGRDTKVNLDNLIFRKESKKLKEVTVTSSKVKFYVKGDTIVYNADAFALPEGSMLDALIKQLPGVEIRDGGEIYVNGKYVESLLLNGSEFFNNNKELMLNNLALYTVKDVSVYDKMSEKSKVVGRDLGDSQYVMDVKLKRDYMSGFVGNIEAGGGTASRYLGRMFNMWYTSRSRLALIANINNLNDSRQPGQNDQYSATNAPGDFRTKMVGLSYNVNSTDDENDWDFNGSTTVSHVRNNTITTSNRTSFLTGGDRYENSFDNATSHDLTISSDNSLNLRPKQNYIGIAQTFKYRNNDQAAHSLSGVFNSEIIEMTQKILETIYSGQATSFADITLNSTQVQSLMSGRSMAIGGGVQYDTKVPHTPDLLSTSIKIDYDRSNYYGFDRYDINYNRIGSRATDYSYTRNHPTHNLNLSAGLAYTFIPTSDLSMSFSGAYFHTSETKDSYFYRLDRLTDAGLFGVLPIDYQSAIDLQQTHLSTLHTHDAYFQYNLTYQKKFDSGNQLMLTIKPVAEYVWRKLDYRQAENNQVVKNNSFKLWFYNTFISYRIGNNFFRLVYDRNVNLLPIDRLVTITDSRDPLNIYVGAKNLKNTALNEFTLSWQFNAMTRHPWNNYLSLAYSLRQDALVSAYSFNSQTGVRTYMMQNVNGNWYARIHDGVYKAFGSANQFDINAISRITYGHNADLTAIDSDVFTKSKIKNLELSEDFRINWRFNKQSVGARARIEWRNTRSNRPDFNNFSATTAQYGVNGTFSLPYNFGIATDLNLYTRRGYAYKELNTTDVVWNARLTYNLKGGHWTFMLDGFDLLHQLSNVSYTVNAQSRVETYTNVLPRYLLFHVQYRFNKQPKQRN